MCEIADVGVACLFLGPASSEQRADELPDDLACICGELPTLLGGGLVVVKGAMYLPVRLLDRGEGILRAENLGAIARERVGVEAAPQLLVCARQPALRIVEASGKGGVLPEQLVELFGKSARWIWDEVSHCFFAFVRVRACLAAISEDARAGRRR